VPLLPGVVHTVVVCELKLTGNFGGSGRLDRERGCPRQSLRQHRKIIVCEQSCGLPFGTIRTMSDKELKRLHEDDDPRGVVAEHAAKFRDILAEARRCSNRAPRLRERVI
jgi:hypothetical protein